MDIKLQKPSFSKISELRPGIHCYHIYAKVLSAKVSENVTNNGRVINVVEGVLADDSASAHFRFTGNHTAHMAEGNSIAVRNGKSNVVDDHIILELDQFGRVTLENELPFGEVNHEKNISATSWEKAPRKNN
jgi:replication factor A1